MAALSLMAAAGGYAFAETVDRVVASVGNTAITASDVQEEYRLDLFLEGKPSNAEPGPAILDQVRGRLIDRVLLEEGAQASEIHVALDDPAVTQQMQEARDRFPAGNAFQQGLSGLGMSEDDLRLHFVAQLEVLRLIDQRLRPEATVEASEIESYYRGTLVPELARQGQNQPPALDDVTDRIREILVQKKINLLLEAWLERLRDAREVKTYGSAQAEGNS
jgi:parvulin-like peptidyl-prolyl isomerase